MKLIFLRHGIASDKHAINSEMDDFRRRLTKEGIVETKEVVQSCYFIFKKLDTIYTSPLVRAVQTAQILYRHQPKSNLEILPSLDPLSDLEDFQQNVKDLSHKGTYCFVGHEPHFSKSISRLLGESSSIVNIEKSGVIVLEGEDASSLKLTVALAPKMIMKF